MSDDRLTPEVVDATSTDVAVAEPRTEMVVHANEPPEASLWRHFATVATTLANTDFVPAPYRNQKAAIMACLAYGHELGLGPMQSLQSIDVIQGKPTLKPEMMRSLILAAGHSFRRVEATSDHVTVAGRRADTGDEETVTFTIEDASAMGLLSKSNWQKMPRAMLSARATAELARSLFPDVIVGASYTPEELGGDNHAPDEVDYVEYEERKPPIQIVTSNPARAGHAVRRAPADDSAPDFGWHTIVSVGGIDEPVDVCNHCTHPVLSHSVARRGCFHCACNYALDAPSGTMKTVGAASPTPFAGEGAPAGSSPVNDSAALAPEGAPPPPPIANVDAHPTRGNVGSVPGQPEVQPANDSSLPPEAGPSADPAPLPNPVTEAKFRRVMIALKENKLGDEARHTIVAFVTGSRTTSSRQITEVEAEMILNVCGQVRVGRLSVEQHDGEWKILVMDEAGRRFLESIERSIAPTHGQHGRVPVDGSTLEPISEAEYEEVI